MNPYTTSSSQGKHQLKPVPCFFFLFLFTIFSATSVSFSSPLSYSDHCSSVVPESTPILLDNTVFPILRTTISHYTGGDRVLGNFSSEFSFNPHKYVSFRPTQNIFKTNTSGVYKIEAYLVFRSSNGPEGSYHPRNHRRRKMLRFLLNGFWSQFSGKLCMVGSASWYSNEGNLLNLDAVLKLNYAMNRTVTRLISGTLESLSSPSNLNYFEPVSLLVFGSASNYKYTLVLGEFDSECSGGISIPQNQSLGLQSREFCSTLGRRINVFKLDYMNNWQNHTPLGQGIDYLPRVMSLNAIQCDEDEQKVQYLLGFGNSSTFVYHQLFHGPMKTLVAEGSWDEKKNQLCIVACQILNSADLPGNAHVGDCSIRLSLGYPTFWSIQNRNSIVGEIWTNKTVNESGYFNRSTFGSDDNTRVSGLRYRYTVIDRVKNLCPIKKPVKRKEERYPKGNSYDMRFDMSVRDSMGNFSWGYAVPVFVGDQIYEQYSLNISRSEVEAKSSYGGPFNISYKISITIISSTTSSFFPNNTVEISAEGVYDDETGKLCMVGCRKLGPDIHKSTGDPMDCEILLRFQFPPINAKKGGFIKGSIKSTRENTNPLYFGQLSASSFAFYSEETGKSIWRMDLEVIMVVISNTLACVFVGLQLFYVKKNPQVLPFVSLVMLVILTVGHALPLVLNVETLFFGNRNRQNVLLGRGGWLEVNEVVVRVVTMVAFLLEFRLLQLAFSARLGDENQKGLSIAEKKVMLVSLPLYIVGVLFALLLNTGKSKYGVKSHSLWGDLKSYGGLVLDGFLFPQILLNVFRVSGEKALCHSFYIGTTCVRLLPHAYDLYRAHNYARNQFDGSYIYANPSADFYSTTWDVFISCGGVLFAVVIYLQQQFGGRCVVLQRLSEIEVYEQVNVESSE